MSGENLSDSINNLFLSEKQKYEIIFHHENGLSSRQIAKLLVLNRKTVLKWIKIFSETGNVKRQPGTGLHRVTSSEEDKQIVKVARAEKNMTLKKIKKQVSKNIPVSTGTVYNRLQEAGIIFKKPKYKPAIPEKHKLLRIEYAKKYLSQFNWDNVNFSDETTIWLCQNNRGQWLFENEENIVKTYKHPLKRHVWGSISIYGVGEIHIFAGIMRKETYLDILNNYVLAFMKTNPHMIYQDDNDPKHRAKIVKAWYVEHQIQHLLWPAYSPDLNPIENVWKLLKERINDYDCTTAEQLERRISSEWKKIGKRIIKRLIRSMPKRLKSVIDQNGEAINY